MLIQQISHEKNMYGILGYMMNIIYVYTEVKTIYIAQYLHDEKKRKIECDSIQCNFTMIQQVRPFQTISGIPQG